HDALPILVAAQLSLDGAAAAHHVHTLPDQPHLVDEPAAQATRPLAGGGRRRDHADPTDDGLRRAQHPRAGGAAAVAAALHLSLVRRALLWGYLRALGLRRAIGA